MARLIRWRASVILVYRYTPRFHKDAPIIAVLQSVVEYYPINGFKKLLNGLRRRGHPWNHKRIHRIYCQMNWNNRCKVKQRLPSRYSEPLTIFNSLK